MQINLSILWPVHEEETETISWQLLPDEEGGLLGPDVVVGAIVGGTVGGALTPVQKGQMILCAELIQCTKFPECI